jgi:hypothetical protein
VVHVPASEMKTPQSIADAIDTVMDQLNSCSVALANMRPDEHNYEEGTPSRRLLDAFCDAMKARDTLRAKAA